MNAVSLMPPVDYCPSCEGRKAEDLAVQIGEGRAQQIEQQATLDTSADRQNTVVQASDPGSTQPVSGASHALLAPDLVVQATLAQSSTSDTEGAAEAQRLRAAAAYGAA